jgi:hypothetical protein
MTIFRSDGPAGWFAGVLMVLCAGWLTLALQTGEISLGRHRMRRSDEPISYWVTAACVASMGAVGAVLFANSAFGLHFLEPL